MTEFLVFAYQSMLVLSLLFLVFIYYKYTGNSKRLFSNSYVKLFVCFCMFYNIFLLVVSTPTPINIFLTDKHPLFAFYGPIFFIAAVAFKNNSKKKTNVLDYKYHFLPPILFLCVFVSLSFIDKEGVVSKAYSYLLNLCITLQLVGYSFYLYHRARVSSFNFKSRFFALAILAIYITISMFHSRLLYFDSSFLLEAFIKSLLNFFLFICLCIFLQVRKDSINNIEYDILDHQVLSVNNLNGIEKKRENKLDKVSVKANLKIEEVVEAQLKVDKVDDDVVNEKKYTKNNISEEKLHKYKTQVDFYIVQKKRFLKQDYSLNNLAEDTGISKHHISQLFSKVYKSSFNKFINQYRIAYSLVILDKDISIAILELGEISGFSSRTSFFRAFKEQMGMSPTEYIQQKTSINKKQ